MLIPYRWIENKTDDEGVDGVFACVLTWQNAAPARPFRHSLLGAAFVIDRVTSTVIEIKGSRVSTSKSLARQDLGEARFNERES